LGSSTGRHHSPVNHAFVLEVSDLARVEVILVTMLSHDPDELGEELGVFVPREHILMRPGLRIGLSEDPRG
jgi:hypothetical protein